MLTTNNDSRRKNLVELLTRDHAIQEIMDQILRGVIIRLVVR
jgi:hypothetical protein